MNIPKPHIPKPPPRNLLDKIIETKFITSNWIICLTSKNHEFFYNLETGESFWDIPIDIVDVIGDLLHGEGVVGSSGESSSEGDMEEMQVEPLPVESVEEVEKVLVEKVLVEPLVEHIPTKQKIEPIKTLKRQEFLQLLTSLKIPKNSTFELQVPKFNQSNQFTQIPLKLAKSVFNDYCIGSGSSDAMEKVQKAIERVDKKIPYDHFLKKFHLKDTPETKTLFQQRITEIQESEKQKVKNYFEYLNEIGAFGLKFSMIKGMKDDRFLAVDVGKRENLYHLYLQSRSKSI
jgi:hypothetical protein